MAENDWPLYPPCLSGRCKTVACCAMGTRSAWPEVVGMEAEQAKMVIENTNFYVVAVVLHGVGLTDFCCNRVYVHVDGNNRVIKVPVVG